MPATLEKRPQQRTTKILQEQTFSGDSPRVDREAGVIHDVKVLGTVSKNGREYSQNALKDACSVLEGCQVNMDHNRDNPSRERGFMESIGTLNGLYLKPDGVYAKEFRVKKTHPNAPVIFESAERFPKNFGLSINAEGEMVKRGGKWIVESIVKAQSVDVVGKPATTDGLFESVEHRKAKTVKLTVKQLVESHGTAEMKSRLSKLMEDGQGGYMDQPVDVDQSVGDGDGTDNEADPMDQINDAFIALVASVMQNASLALADKVKQVTAILTTQDSLLNGDAAPPKTNTVTEDDQSGDDGEEGDEEKMSESIKTTLDELRTLLVESQAKTSARQDEIEARQLLIESNIKPLPDRIKTLSAEKDESKRQSLLESWPTERIAPKKPAVSSPLFESSSEEAFPKDHKSFIAKLKR